MHVQLSGEVIVVVIASLVVVGLYLLRQLDKAQRQIEGLMQERDKNWDQVGELTKELDKAQRHIEGLTQERDKNREQVGGLAKELDKAWQEHIELQKKFRAELTKQVNKARREAAEEERKSGYDAALAGLLYYHAKFDERKHGFFTRAKAGSDMFLVLSTKETSEGKLYIRVRFANFVFEESEQKDLGKIISTFVKVSGPVAAIASGQAVAGAALAAAPLAKCK